jgi:hypothetical protein
MNTDQPEPTLPEIARRLEAFAWHFEVDAEEFGKDEPAHGGYMRTAGGTSPYLVARVPEADAR